MVWRYAVIVVAGYLLGNISMGLIVSERYHMDIRNYGSGNAGTTNVLRTLGWLPSALTVVGAALKSFAASMLGQWLAGAPGLLLGGFMAVVGHNWPVFCGFRGGKGMAASLGIIFALSWQMALGFLRRNRVADQLQSGIHPSCSGTQLLSATVITGQSVRTTTPAASSARRRVSRTLLAWSE